MKKSLIIILLLALAFAGAWYWSVRVDQQAIEQAEVLTPELPAPEPVPPPIEHPIGEVEAPPLPEPETPQVPLPSLAESDPELIEHAQAALGEEPLERLFVAERIIPRFVATIDSLTSAKVAPLMLPVKPAPGRFQVMESGEAAVIAPRNAERYQAYAGLATSVDTGQLVAVYTRYYPLFQQAYSDLGYPEAYFNDRLVAVIDHLLATPEPEGLIEVRRDEAVFEFVDPRLEALSAGQKALLRMGADNAGVVKAKLREIRAALTR